MPSAPKKPTQNWWVDQRLRTRGMPTRSLARDGRTGAGRRKASFRTISATLGYSRLTSSSLALTTRISLTSSTRPFGTGVAADDALPALRRAAPCSTAGRAPSGSCTSMNVRLQLTGHQWQTVSALVVLVYVSASIVSKPRKRVARRPARQSSAQSAAPIAPASPEYGWTTISASGTLPRMKSTCALTTARLRCVPPCRTNLRPTARRFWSWPA